MKLVPISEVNFKVVDKKSGEGAVFCFTDVYGYEGEVIGVVLKT